MTHGAPPDVARPVAHRDGRGRGPPASCPRPSAASAACSRPRCPPSPFTVSVPDAPATSSSRCTISVAAARGAAGRPARAALHRRSSCVNALFGIGIGCALRATGAPQGGRRRRRSRRWPTSCPGIIYNAGYAVVHDVHDRGRLAAGRLHGRQRRRGPDRLAPRPAGRAAVPQPHLAAGRCPACCGWPSRRRSTSPGAPA